MTTSSATVSWDQALTALEARLDHVEQLLVHGPLEELSDPLLLAGVAPGSVDGVLPLRLAERAARVRSRTDALVAAVSERLSETGRSIGAGETARRRRLRRVPAYLDERA